MSDKNLALFFAIKRQEYTYFKSNGMDFTAEIIRQSAKRVAKYHKLKHEPIQLELF